MHKEINQPYHAGLRHLSATYRLNVGSLFYFGSSSAIGLRHSNHTCDLKNGTHPNKRLQDEFNATGLFQMVVLTEIPCKADDTDKDHEARLRLNEQWLLDQHKDDPNLANASESAFCNSNAGSNLKARWQDPAFREAQIKRMKARRGDAISPECREKMAQAKRGDRNAKSRACEITLNGKSRKFESVREAALAHGVAQQAMDLWMRGVVPWPGTGKRKPRPSSAHLTGMTGRLL